MSEQGAVDGRSNGFSNGRSFGLDRWMLKIENAMFVVKFSALRTFSSEQIIFICFYFTLREIEVKIVICRQSGTFLPTHK